MSYLSSWHFLLGLILLTVIYGNVKSYELNEVSARKNIFSDIKNFFDRIFNPHSEYAAPEVIQNITIQQNTTSTLKYKPDSKPTYVRRRNPKTYKKYRFQSDLIEDIKKKQGVSEIDMKSKNSLRSVYFFLDWFTKLFNITVKSDKDQENQYRRSDDSGEDSYVENQRRQYTSNLKTLIILVTEKKKEHEEVLAREGLSYLGLSKSFKRDDSLLRQAYGDACIKVAIRKCYKALQRVNNMVCRTRFKCKSSFKSTFLLKAKKGCITGFDFRSIFNETKEPKIEEVIPVDEMDYHSRALADEKREKYIDACIPYMLPERSSTVPADIHLGNNLSELVTLILRSESERKCQKFSREACVIACIFARDEVCSTYICGRKKKNAFKKDCKNECKRSYSIKSDSDSSSRSSSGSD